jgi:DnaK suppressor protein
MILCLGGFVIMQHLTKEQIEELRRILLQKKKETLERIENFLKDSSLKVSSNVGDEIDVADREMERQRQISLREKESEYLKQIEYALRKIEEGTYGICERCGEPISYERLKARPISIYCIKCKKKLEEED